ncbi:hypothetical protein [Tunicatimonas pelagia]|uniref:hypothetical protein n=1 Tax=Tunicatimonas pelagia TaxID=931531 RepID=UPI002666711F|nr:hypothetical protein [Tunicatimonas pelagia]WKN41302.1 hypothetical protein P0M28_19900 [Tunicatimonas pelagia]
MEANNDRIISALQQKGVLKQQIYQQTKEVFQQLNEVLQGIAKHTAGAMGEDSPVEVAYKAQSDFESSLRFSGDMLVFMMHTNVFTFNPEYFVHKSGYVKEDPTRAYCGMIVVYNFLSDSLRYNRLSDVGYLIGRIFINKDRHFFVEGRREFAFRYSSFSQQPIDEKTLHQMAEAAVVHAIDFDLFVPPIDGSKQLSVKDKLQASGLSAIRTGKRVGFEFLRDQE